MKLIFSLTTFGIGSALTSSQTPDESESGVEAAMVRVLNLVGVEIEWYHNGNLASRDGYQEANWKRIICV